MNRTILTIIAGLALSGCGNQMDITTAPVNVVKTNGFDNKNFVGLHPVKVRSYFVTEKSKDAKAKTTEFANAACQIAGNGYSAQFSTPAIVNLPDHGFYSQAVSGSCQIGGVVRPILARPYNITIANIKSNTGIGGGLIGIIANSIATGVMLAANDPTNDDFGYRPIGIKFPAQ